MIAAEREASASEASWHSQPIDRPPGWPELRAEALHGPAGELVQKLEPHTEADPVALLLQLLVGFGSLVGRGPYFQVEADRHYPNLYAVLVGETAKARKGTSLSRVRELLGKVDSEWERERVQHGLSSGEGLIWAVRDPIARARQDREEIVDSGVQDKRLLIVEGELASVLQVIQRQGNTLSPLLRTAWDRGDLQSLTKNSPARAQGAHVSIVAHITREELLRRLDSTEAANGFGNRFLWALTCRSKYLPEGGRLVQDEISYLLSELEDARAFAKQMGTAEVCRDEEARDLWIAEYASLSEGRPGLAGALTARGEAQVMRLALVYALLDRSPSIREKHLSAALALWAYCEQSVGYIFGDRFGDPLADELRRVLRSHPGGLTRTEIRDHFSRHQSRAKLDQALALLKREGHIRRAASGPTGGRPAEVWIST